MSHEQLIADLARVVFGKNEKAANQIMAVFQGQLLEIARLQRELVEAQEQAKEDLPYYSLFVEQEERAEAAEAQLAASQQAHQRAVDEYSKVVDGEADALAQIAEMRTALERLDNVFAFGPVVAKIARAALASTPDRTLTIRTDGEHVRSYPNATASPPNMPTPDRETV